MAAVGVRTGGRTEGRTRTQMDVDEEEHSVSELWQGWGQKFVNETQSVMAIQALPLTVTVLGRPKSVNVSECHYIQ